jgi:hypothetical protein
MGVSLEQEDLDAGQADLLRLLEHGNQLVQRLEGPHTMTLHEEERLGKLAAAYMFAAQALLGGLYERHTELVEHPHFVALRRAARNYGR